MTYSLLCPFHLAVALMHEYKHVSNVKIILPLQQVTDQNLDVWQNLSACVPDALRHYYYQYLSSTGEAAGVHLEYPWNK